MNTQPPSTDSDLINALLAGHCPAIQADAIKLVETHISWVLLTDEHAYKIKKPVDFGFLDFSTLAKRKQFCEEELRLNRRLAAHLYLGLFAICGSINSPELVPLESSEDHGNAHIPADSEIIDYAICMRRFPQSAQLDERLEAGLLTPENMDAIGTMLADFHESLPPADDSIHYGDVAHVTQPVADNFQVLHHFFEHSNNSDDTASLDTLNKLERWSEQQNQALNDTFIQRKQAGFIREGHGDLHLRNMIWMDDLPLAFDCLEFEADLRWTDVMCEIAFLIMDLQSRQHSALAYRCLNQYLQQTGDYAGLRLLPYYLAYRALVRAKVDALRHDQSGLDAQETAETDRELHAYLELASTYSEPRTPHLMITRGLSASGKSTISKPLAAELGAIRIRSDVERKRLYQLSADQSASNLPEAGLYTAAASEATYQHLLTLAETVLAAGFDVIIDAVFLKEEQRKPFQELANQHQYRFSILEFEAGADTLRQRIQTRAKGVSDADLSILEYQLTQWQPLAADEAAARCSINTEQRVDTKQLAARLQLEA